MVPISNQIRRAVEIPTAVGWMITDPKQADEVIKNQQADVVLLARELLRDPYWPYHAAKQLGIENAAEILPIQYARAVKR